MNKKIAILQSNYIPWKGFFDIINLVDEFIIYDTVQYTKNDWRNRNKIKTSNGLLWLTIPIKRMSTSKQVNEAKVANDTWQTKHYKSIVQNYSKARYFKDYKGYFEKLYNSALSNYLSDINLDFIKLINHILSIKTKISFSNEFNLSGGRTEKLINICKQSCADTYLSGPSAKNYLNQDLFLKNNIKIEWMDYSNYPEYAQLSPPFEHNVSIIDLIFNSGPDATEYMKSFKDKHFPIL